MLAFSLPAGAAEPPGPAPAKARFLGEPASEAARGVADWVVASGDNQRLPFVIVDKVQARIFVFDARGQLRGAAAALLGLAIGDDTTPGIGERKLAAIRPEERTTPAGRFVAALGPELGDKEVVWVDYEAAVSLHPVVTGKPKERRLQRLVSPSPSDNRISYGCINVPAAFYAQVVEPAFRAGNGIVYILPEVRSIRSVFGAYPGDEPGTR